MEELLKKVEHLKETLNEYKLCPDFDMDCFDVQDCLLCHLYELIGFCPFI